MLAAGQSAAEVVDAARERGLAHVLLIVGAGGTGKSAVLKVIGDVLAVHSVTTLVTAYTGVAASPFGARRR